MSKYVHKIILFNKGSVLLHFFVDLFDSLKIIMIPRETLLNKSTLDILIPNGKLDYTEDDVKMLFTSKARTLAFYDEILHFYLVLNLPYGSSNFDESVAKAFFQQLDVNIEVSLIESAHFSVPSQPPHPACRFPMTRSDSSSTDASPSTPGSPLFPSVIEKRSSKMPEEMIMHSLQFNTNQKDRNVMVVEYNNCWTGVVSLSLPIAFLKSHFACPMLSFNATVALQSLEIAKQSKKATDTDLYSMHHFGGNLLAGLIGDPSFGSENTIFCAPLADVNFEPRRPVVNLTTSPVKRTCSKVLPVKTALNVRMRTTNVSPLENSMMISISVENNNIESISSFMIESIKVHVSHGFVARYECVHDDATGRFPLTLNSIDQATFLYNVTILEKPALPKPSPPQHCPTPLPNSSTRSHRDSVASVFSNTSFTPQNDNQRRPLTITIKGTPILVGEKTGNIESKWNCILDLTSLFKRDDSAVPNRLSISGTVSQRASLNSRYGLSEVSSSGSSVFLSTGITTPSVTKSIYSAILSGYMKKPAVGSTMSDNAPMCGEIANNTNGILSGGRTPLTNRPTEVNVGDDIMLSLSVGSKVMVGKVFSVRVFIVNKSKISRKFAIIVHNKKRRSDATIIHGNTIHPIEPFMSETEFLGRHLESETPEAGIFCLNNNVQIGPILPSTCESVTLHFIAMKESLHPIELMQLVDTETGQMTNLRNVLEILVPRTSTKREFEGVEAIVKRHAIV
ncbi:9987_t:CDS:2 [Acaulospora morrowiae]|uniref:9987_t:CDS:1 n=1 Tax=Acaulospora morrowiae TaxID=94023 RepID=A0A9N9FGZ6_9GLOM|nr:9987_t:CDS:2 [Acaulospora morrowiae]